MKKQTIISVLTLLVILCVVFAGCGKDQTSGTAPDPQAGQMTTGEPVQDDTIEGAQPHVTEQTEEPTVVVTFGEEPIPPAPSAPSESATAPETVPSTEATTQPTQKPSTGGYSGGDIWELEEEPA